MKYLRESIRTLEELKKEYHRLCLKLHPDVGGSNEEMKILNAEYEMLFERVKNVHVNKNGETYERETEETSEAFQALITELLKMDGIEIEIIGCFVWVSGNTKPHKERLKALDFKWHSKKLCWYKSPDGYRRWGKGRVYYGRYSHDVQQCEGSTQTGREGTSCIKGVRPMKTGLRKKCKPCHFYTYKFEI